MNHKYVQLVPGRTFGIKECDIEMTLTQKQEFCVKMMYIHSIVVEYTISQLGVSNKYEKNPPL